MALPLIPAISQVLTALKFLRFTKHTCTPAKLHILQDTPDLDSAKIDSKLYDIPTFPKD